MNQSLQDLYGRLERCELIILNKQKEMVWWEVEKEKIQKNINELERRAKSCVSGTPPSLLTHIP